MMPRGIDGITGIAATDFSEALDVLEHARVADLVRFVNRNLAAHDELRQLNFADGWAMLLTGYTSQAIRGRRITTDVERAVE